MPPSPQHATVYPRFPQGLLDTHRQAWLSLLRGHFFSPGSRCMQSFVCTLQNLFLQYWGSSVIKSHWPPKSSSLEFSVALPGPQVGKSVVGPRSFLTVQEFLWYNYCAVVGLLLSGSMMELVETSSKRAHATRCVSQVCCCQSPSPCGRPLLTLASTGYIQTFQRLVWLSLCILVCPGFV